MWNLDLSARRRNVCCFWTKFSHLQAFNCLPLLLARLIQRRRLHKAHKIWCSKCHPHCQYSQSARRYCKCHISNRSLDLGNSSRIRNTWKGGNIRLCLSVRRLPLCTSPPTIQLWQLFQQYENIEYFTRLKVAFWCKMNLKFIPISINMKKIIKRNKNNF